MAFIPWAATAATLPLPIPPSALAPGAWLSLLAAPAGALAETFPRILAGTLEVSAGTGVVVASAVSLTAGTTVSNITMVTGTQTEVTGTHGWYALLDSTGKVLAVTADQTGAAVWPANTAVTLPVGSPFAVTATGTYYCAVSVTAGTVPNFCGFGQSTQNAAGKVPVLCGTAGTQNTPPSVGTVLTIASASNAAYYAYVS